MLTTTPCGIARCNERNSAQNKEHIIFIDDELIGTKGTNEDPMKNAEVAVKEMDAAGMCLKRKREKRNGKGYRLSAYGWHRTRGRKRKSNKTSSDQKPNILQGGIKPNEQIHTEYSRLMSRVAIITEKDKERKSRGRK